MSDTIRELIVDKIITEMGKIKVSAGYDTNAGDHVFRSRTGDLEPHELPGLVIWDGEDKVSEHTANKHSHELTVEVEAWCDDTGHEEDETYVDSFLNKLIADVNKVIGQNRRWGGYAENTVPTDDVKYFDLRDKVTGVAIIRFVVKFRTVSYNAYQQ